MSSDTGVLNVIKCARFPVCLCVSLELNPELDTPERSAEICDRIQRENGGGLCPHAAKIICLWADLCARGLDPTPYVAAMTTGRMPGTQENKGQNEKSTGPKPDQDVLP